MHSTVFQSRKPIYITETFQKFWYSSEESNIENKKRPLENYELFDCKIPDTTEENPSKRRCISLLSSKETNAICASEVKDIKSNIIETVQFSVDTGYNPQTCYENISDPQEYFPSSLSSSSTTIDNGYGERNTDKSYRPRYNNGKYCRRGKPYHTSNSGWQSISIDNGYGERNTDKSYRPRYNNGKYCRRGKPYHTSNSGWQSYQKHTSQDYRQKHYTASDITYDASLPVNSSKSYRRSGHYSIYDDDGYNVRGYYTSGFYPQL